MPIKPFFLSSAFTLGLVSSLGAYTVGSNYDVTVLADTVTTYDYTQFEGISKNGGTLYMGNFRSVKQYDLSLGQLSDYGTLRGNNNISHVTYANGKVYASTALGFNEPFPYALNSVSQGGTSSEVLVMGGIFDAKTAPSGSLYFVASPDVDDDGIGDGTRLFRLNYGDNTATEIAYFGGASGGMAFDTDGNLYYSHYDNNAVYRFDAEDLLGGNLDLSDGTVALSLQNPGYLDFNSKGQLVASQLNGDWDTIISIYDLANQVLIEEVFRSYRGNYEGMGGFVTDGDDLYVILQNWDIDGDYGSQLLALTQVPEPAAFAFAFALVAAAAVIRRRRSM